MAEMEFRANFVIWLFASLFWFATSFIFIELFYGQAQSIAGWTKNEALILADVFNLYIGFIWIFILPNITHFHNLIRKGDFDFLLTKPVNLRFLVSTRVEEFDQYPRIFVGLIFLFILTSKANLVIGWWLWLDAVVVMLFSLIIFYNFYFVLMTTNIWFINIFNLENLIDSVNDIGRFPVQIFNGVFRVIFIYIIPVAFVATFPTQILLKKELLSINIISILMVVTTFAVSQWFWNFALKRYSSASS